MRTVAGPAAAPPRHRGAWAPRHRRSEVLAPSVVSAAWVAWGACGVPPDQLGRRGVRTA